MDEVLLNKAAIIERCLGRVREEYGEDGRGLRDQTRQDAIVLNIERACQAAIDMAMRLTAKEHLGVPQSSAEAFDLLARAGKISEALATRLRAMTGFRNIAVHEYQALDLEILRKIVESGAADFKRFCLELGVEIKSGKVK